ncbi:ABC transporter permease [Bradyrhizobium neotropicale]|uniref:ABC transporter permease n=1 Tax=Bradyrhizobium neotropicale TaxID=1497615 RepID=UPI001AD661DC|nr:ABC transporter permease [Bradyrhizobium neotropicale]MBO4221550.1 ABC transporter permease [Bradyrhizobium neotropicale]
MLTELESSIGSDVLMGLAQAAGAIALCAAVVALCRWHAVRVEREAAVSMARGLVQMVLVGMVLAVLLHGNLLIGTLILLMMTVAAAFTAARRLQGLEGALLLCFWAITAGAGTVIAAMLATRSLRADIAILVPVGSMIIANAMNACAQAAERFRAEIVAHVGQIEAGLSLGAEPTVTVTPYLQSAVYASLLPRLDMLKSLGLVWIPGVMAGMMVSGASPVYAAIYQFVVVAMILAASGITGLMATLLMRSRVFTSAAQLALRPAEASTSGPAATRAHP